MKHSLLFVMVCTLCAFRGYAQNTEIQVQRIITVPSGGFQVEFQPTTGAFSTHFPALPVDPLTPGLNWQATDAYSIDNYAKVSSQSLKTAAGWGLNDQRMSLYGASNIPEWEVPFTINAWAETASCFVSMAEGTTNYSY